MSMERSDPTSADAGAEVYSISEAQAQEDYVEIRTAAEWVGFVLPHLRPGTRLLDCGCGVGSITLDLAELVAPGPVVGIDVDPIQLHRARARARERRISNADFEVANVYELPFPDGSFDAVLAHTLLVHLRDRPRVLREMRRVLRPGGIVGVADDDFATAVVAPESPLVEQGLAIWTHVLRHNGGDAFYSRHLRRLLLDAGFQRTEGHAVAADHSGTLAETRRFAGVYARLLRHPPNVALITGQGWADRAALAAIADAFEAWGERPDAFLAITYFAAVGWNGETVT